MKIIFSKNDKVGSKAIRYASSIKEGVVEWKKLPSHVAFLFFDFWVLESAFPTGFQVRPYFDFLKDNEIVAHFSTIEKDSPGVVKHLVKRMWGRKYDFLGVLYQGISILSYSIFRGKLSKSNPWERKNRVSCQEVISLYTGESYEVSTPYDLMLKFEKSKYFIRLT